MTTNVTAMHVGTSGWAYPSWKPGFYPAGTAGGDFLGYYARRFDTVELNTTGYRLPPAEQFRRWAEQTPPGFTFAPKLNAHRRAPVAAFADRLRALGDRLGPARLVVSAARDDELLARVTEGLGDGVRVAWDFRHESWRDVELPAGAVAVNALEGDAPFRYVRLREPPYTEDDLREWAARLRGIDGEVFVYLRHEDEPTAPAYAERLLALLAESAS